jgi:GTPase SAR1 family protein
MKLQFIVLGGANAGKSSILRRYFYGKFDPGRMPTMGADYFSSRVDYTTLPEESEQGDDKRHHSMWDEKEGASPLHHKQDHIWVQVWDTPGRERYSMLDKKKARYTASFSDDFLKNVDAAVLVYDVSSSTSFTHVLKWHSELMERLQRMKENGERIRPLPILIVGNKIDIFEERVTEKELRKIQVVKQRSVLGLHNQFRGIDYRYEYTTNQPSTIPLSSSASVASSNTKSHTRNKTKTHQPTSSRNRFELSTYMGTKTSYLESILNNEVYRGSYLDSLLSSEDKSHPDKDMVLLWCMRNGLTHMDVSAKRGIGINELMQQLIKMAMEEKNTDRDRLHQVSSSGKISALHRNDELDLHRRYAPKSRSCFQLPFQPCCNP